jgi:peroxiredoxin
MKKIALFSIALLGVFSWGFGQEFKLNGKLNAFKPVEKVFFSYNNGSKSIFDSVPVTNGSFEIKGNINEPVVAFMSLKFVRKAGQPVIDDATQIYLEPSNMTLVATSSLKNLQLTGSKCQPDFEKIKKEEKTYSMQLQKLQGAVNAARNANNKTAMAKATKDLADFKQVYAEEVYAGFLKKNPETPIGLYLVSSYKTYEQDGDKAMALYNTLPVSLQQLPSGVELRAKIETTQKTAIGKYAMDFTQNDTLGNPITLSSFKGKYVLLDFWASWCHPCRLENPNVVKAFNKYKDKNFTVLSVSLDNNKEKWLKAINDDGMPWTHVSDLDNWKNAVARLYGISSVPQNLLIDPQGKIIAKNLRGEALEAKLAEVIKL